MAQVWIQVSNGQDDSDFRVGLTRSDSVKPSQLRPGSRLGMLVNSGLARFGSRSSS
ncbi:hypothetical protein Hanom_Chr17g01543261 [Helianthus anomalus]